VFASGVVVREQPARRNRSRLKVRERSVRFFIPKL
jgi:hypothetical protein